MTVCAYGSICKKKKIIISISSISYVGGGERGFILKYTTRSCVLMTVNFAQFLISLYTQQEWENITIIIIISSAGEKNEKNYDAMWARKTNGINL